EAVVEDPAAKQRLAPRKHERARRPVAVELAVVRVEVELPLAGPRRMNGPSLRPQRLAEGAHRVREPTDGRGELAVGPHLLDPCEPDARAFVERSHEIAERPSEDLRVGV